MPVDKIAYKTPFAKALTNAWVLFSRNENEVLKWQNLK